MDPSRRDLLLGLTAASLTACGPEEAPADSGTASEPTPAPDRAPEPADWDPGGTEDLAAFAQGVQAGDALEDGVLLHARTAEIGCSLVVVAADGDAWVEVLRRESLDSDGTAIRLEIDGLEPDTAHRYAFFAADGIRRSASGRFRTAMGSESPLRKLVLGATSCLGSGNPTYPTLAVAAEQQLDAMLLLGDSVYADSASSTEQYRLVWANMLGKDNARALFASTSVIATWDDHEVDNNWIVSVTTPADRVQRATEAFREAIPQREGPAGTGMWRTLPLGPVADVFVMDSRGERDGFTRFVSPEQLDGMTAAIRASRAHFKIVLCSVHLTDHTQVMGPVEDADRWQGWPVQREALVRACEEVGGAFVVTGDMHFSAIQLVGRPGEPGESLVELAAGPAGSNLVPMDAIVGLASEPPPQYLWVGATWTCTRITLDPGTGEVHAEFLDDDGQVVGEHRWTP